MRGGWQAEVVDGLDLRLDGAGICLACLTFVAFPLDSGDERSARREARRMAPDLWAEGLELTAMLALENAKREGVERAEDAIEDVRRNGSRSAVVQAIVWRLAELMVEDIRARASERAERCERPDGLACDFGDELEVAVVVEHRQVGELGGGGDEEIRKRDAAVVKRPGRGEELEDVGGTPPDAVSHGDVAQSLEIVAFHRQLGVISSRAQQLEPHHRARGDRAGTKLGAEVVENGRVFAAVRPRARVGELDQSPQARRRSSSS